MVAESWSWILPVAKEAYDNREAIATNWDKFRKFFDGKNTTIAVTGLPGAGKSVLCDYLTGEAYKRDYQKPGKSEKLEKGIVSTKSLNIRLATVPGQDSPNKLQALDELFDQDSPIDGVIYVVANGFTNVRSAFAQELLAKKNSLVLYRESQFAQEIEDLGNICELIRKSIRRSGRPKWLLVAVTKIDLYYDDIETARDRYYRGESDFSARIQRLSNQVGSDNFTWDAFPVCSSLDDFILGKETVISKFKEEQRSYYIRHFLQKIKALCEAT
jgi:GTPase SAR1 family protein